VKWLAGALLSVVLLLQYRLWLSGDGVRELARLSESVEQQRADNEEAVERNKQLIAEVADLKAGMAAIEERARSKLGMIGATKPSTRSSRPPAYRCPRPAEQTKTAALT
jgi:cell division protein FtsB